MYFFPLQGWFIFLEKYIWGRSLFLQGGGGGGDYIKRVWGGGGKSSFAPTKEKNRGGTRKF